MVTQYPNVKEVSNDQRSADRMRLLGFVTDEEIGPGSVVARVSHASGIAPCGCCSRRATALNKWMVFTR